MIHYVMLGCEYDNLEDIIKDFNEYPLTRKEIVIRECAYLDEESSDGEILDWVLTCVFSDNGLVDMVVDTFNGLFRKMREKDKKKYGSELLYVYSD